MNIRNSVPNDHIQSISEIAKSQSSMIQLLTIENHEKDKEIERLNKVIDELEEYLNKIIDTSAKCEKITCQYVLQYLQKLKGSDKDEK